MTAPELKQVSTLQNHTAYLEVSLRSLGPSPGHDPVGTRMKERHIDGADCEQADSWREQLRHENQAHPAGQPEAMLIRSALRGDLRKTRRPTPRDCFSKTYSAAAPGRTWCQDRHGTGYVVTLVKAVAINYAPLSCCK